jgi:hypothetical protein
MVVRGGVNIFGTNHIAGTTDVDGGIRHHQGHHSTSPRQGAGNRFDFACGYGNRLEADANAAQPPIDYYNICQTSVYDPNPSYNGTVFENSANAVGLAPTPAESCPPGYSYADPVSGVGAGIMAFYRIWIIRLLSFPLMAIQMIWPPGIGNR